MPKNDDLTFPMFELPFEVACSPRLSKGEKLLYASLHSWLYMVADLGTFSRVPPDFEEIRRRVAMEREEFLETLGGLREKGVVDFDLETNRYVFLDPPWIREDAREFACGPLTLVDDESWEEAV